MLNVNDYFSHLKYKKSRFFHRKSHYVYIKGRNNFFLNRIFNTWNVASASFDMKRSNVLFYCYTRKDHYQEKKKDNESNQSTH